MAVSPEEDQNKAARNCLGKGMVWEKNRSITEN
jgi:hypothetical protein